MRYLWGLVLVAVGGGYLAAEMGYIEYTQINQIWMWWPLILVFIGVDVLTKKLKYGWLFMIALTIISGLVIYDVSFAPKSSLGISEIIEQSKDVKNSEIIVEKKGEYKRAEIQVDTGAVNFDIANITEDVINGSLDSNFANAQTVVDDDSGNVKIGISTVSIRHQMMWLGRNIKNDLRLALNNSLPIYLKINTGASDLNFDLSEYIISGLDLNSGASSMKVRLGESVENGAIVNVEGGASSVEFEVPKALGVRITTKSGLSSNDFQDFTKVGEAYENSAYKNAQKKIEINFQTGASSVVVRQY